MTDTVAWDYSSLQWKFMRDEAPPDLIQRARQDRAGFAVLYDHYLPRVYAFCRAYSTTREDAEDLTAETFEKALGAIARYEDRGHPFSTWLLRIAANTVIDRARRSRPTHISDRVLAELEDDSVVATWEHAYWLHLHIAALPQEQREVVRLRFYADQPFAEIGRQMGRSEGAAKQLLRRALKTLHLRLTQELQGEMGHD